MKILNEHWGKYSIHLHTNKWSHKHYLWQRKLPWAGRTQNKYLKAEIKVQKSKGSPVQVSSHLFWKGPWRLSNSTLFFTQGRPKKNNKKNSSQVVLRFAHCQNTKNQNKNDNRPQDCSKTFILTSILVIELTILSSSIQS